jgi:hypothetical protein
MSPALSSDARKAVEDRPAPRARRKAVAKPQARSEPAAFPFREIGIGFGVGAVVTLALLGASVDMIASFLIGWMVAAAVVIVAAFTRG